MKNKWLLFLKSFSKEKPVLSSLLQLGEVIEVDDDSIDIRFEKNYAFQYNEIKNHDNRVLIEKSIEKFYGKKFQLHLTLSERKKEIVVDKKIENSDIKGHHISAIQDEIEQEPIVKKVLEIFNAEIL